MGIERYEPIDELATIRPGLLDLTDPEQRRAYVQAMIKLSYCRDTQALIEQRLHGGSYGELRNNFSAEKED